MKQSIQSPKVIAGIVTALLIIALTALVFTYEMNQSLKTGLNNEKLKSEKMLSEKLSLDKEIMKMKQSIASLQGKNADLDKMLKYASSKISMKENELKKMQKENASMKSYKQQLAEIQAIRSELETKISALTNSLNTSMKEKEALNRMVADLQAQNSNLNSEINKMQIARLDDIRIEAFKKNKLTVSAKKTNKLDINFLIPATNNSNNMQFRIVDPSGRLLTPLDGSIVMIEIDEMPIMTADNSSTIYLKETKQIKMEYKPKKKLKPGVYKIEVLNSESVYMGSLQVRLK